MIDKQVETGERDDAPSLSGVVSGIGSVEPCDQTTQKPPKDTLNLRGVIVPLKESRVFKGRAF